MDLADVVRTLADMPPAELAILKRQVDGANSRFRWVPNPGPQTDAYYSLADVLLYGGEPGGGKSQLGLGLAFNEHQKTLVMRREYGDLDQLISDALKIHGSRDGFNGSPPPRLRISAEQIINFAAAHRVGDEEGQMGKGKDLVFIDEATHFAQSQIRFVMGWNRTEDPNQRCRVVLATNPPLRPEGMWVIEMFAPWLNPQYHNPAKAGELRWVVSDEDGNDRWVDGPGEYEVVVAGEPKMVKALSRTYIPASVKDNPYYVASGYEKTLDSLPEPMRSILLGGFRTAFKDRENQIIPTAWVTMAQQRWMPKPPEGIPMCAIGVDASGGGVDPMVIAPRHDAWFAPTVEVQGKDIPVERAGAYCSGMILGYWADDARIVVDMGGGYGASIYEHMHANKIPVSVYKGAEGTTKRTRDGKLGFTNVRTAALWAFRELLDPGQPGGSPAALPPDPQIMADLTAPTAEITQRGWQAEPKEDVCKRLGRSTNHGDALIMSWFEGARALTNAMDWMDLTKVRGRLVHRPQVVNSGRLPLSVRMKR